MNRMMPASRTKLLRLQAFGIFPLVLGRGVISFLAVRTLQSNDVSHKNSEQPQKGTRITKDFCVFCAVLWLFPLSYGYDIYLVSRANRCSAFPSVASLSSLHRH